MSSIINLPASFPSHIANSNPSIPSIPLLSQPKCPITFIIQPPVSTLLTKRCKSPVELNELLAKKLKTESSQSSSNQCSPILKGTSEDTPNDSLDALECHSTIEDPRSPSSKSMNQENDKAHQRLIEELPLAQRSFSTPNPFGLHIPKSSHDAQKQLVSALEVLKKKILLEQQANIISGIIQRAKLAQDPLMIPPLYSVQKQSLGLFGEQVKPVFKSREGEPDIIVGDIEYPLLEMAAQQSKGLLMKENSKGEGKSKTKKRSKLLDQMSPEESGKSFDNFVSSLTVTRAETQLSRSRSDSELSEEVEKKTVGKKRGAKKQPVEKGKKMRKRKE